MSRTASAVCITLVATRPAKSFWKKLHALAQHVAVRLPAHAHREVAEQALMDDGFVPEFEDRQDRAERATPIPARPSQWSCQKVARSAADSQSTSLPRKANSDTSMSAITAANSEEARSSGPNGLE